MKEIPGFDVGRFGCWAFVLLAVVTLSMCSCRSTNRIRAPLPPTLTHLGACAARVNAYSLTLPQGTCWSRLLLTFPKGRPLPEDLRGHVRLRESGTLVHDFPFSSQTVCETSWLPAHDERTGYLLDIREVLDMYLVRETAYEVQLEFLTEPPSDLSLWLFSIRKNPWWLPLY